MRKWFLPLALICSLAVGVLSGCATTPKYQQEKAIVAYFSATGNTEAIAEGVAKLTHGDLYKITPAVPYSKADLYAKNADSRIVIEQKEPKVRPPLASAPATLDPYDIIYIGYPIWYGQAPRLIYTFIEKYDLKDKTIVPFCTSHQTGLSPSAEALKELAPKALWKEGHGFFEDDDLEDIEQWLQQIHAEPKL